MMIQREIKLEPTEPTEATDFSYTQSLHSPASFCTNRTPTTQSFLFPSPTSSPDNVYENQAVQTRSDILTKFEEVNTNILSPLSSSTPHGSFKAKNEPMLHTPSAGNPVSVTVDSSASTEEIAISTSPLFSSPQRQSSSFPLSDGSNSSTTNFSIEEILKPTFGSKKSLDEGHRPTIVSSNLIEQEKAVSYLNETCKRFWSVTNMYRVLNGSKCLQNHSYDDQSDSNTSLNSTNSHSFFNNDTVQNHKRSVCDDSLCEGHDRTPQKHYNGYISWINNDHVCSFPTDTHYLPWEFYINSGIPFTNALNHLFHGFDPYAFRRELFHHLNASKTTDQPELKLNESDDHSVQQQTSKEKPLKDNIKLSGSLNVDDELKNSSKSLSISNLIPDVTKASPVSATSNNKRKLSSVTSASSKKQCNDVDKNVLQPKEKGNNLANDAKKEVTGSQNEQLPWPAWVYCTRYSDRPSSGPRYRKPRKKTVNDAEKRPRTAFSSQQLQRLKLEFDSCPYLSETRRQRLADELGLNESQVKIWFQNKRAKLKKGTGSKNILAMKLMEEGLYNHSTVIVDDNSDEKDTGR